MIQLIKNILCFFGFCQFKEISRETVSLSNEIKQFSRKLRNYNLYITRVEYKCKNCGHTYKESFNH
jgi:hypothetical protein